jgi:hypothetical protein
MGSRDVLGILFLDILVENWPIVSTITLSRKMKAVSRVLLECTHEPLQSPVEIRSCIGGRICGQSKVGITIGATAIRIHSIIRAGSVWQRDYSLSRLMLEQLHIFSGLFTYEVGST